MNQIGRYILTGLNVGVSVFTLMPQNGERVAVSMRAFPNHFK